MTIVNGLWEIFTDISKLPFTVRSRAVMTHHLRNAALNVFNNFLS